MTDNETKHETSIMLVGIMDELGAKKITLDEALAKITQREEDTAHIPQPDFFNAVRGLATKVADKIFDD